MNSQLSLRSGVLKNFRISPVRKVYSFTQSIQKPPESSREFKVRVVRSSQSNKRLRKVGQIQAITKTIKPSHTGLSSVDLKPSPIGRLRPKLNSRSRQLKAKGISEPVDCEWPIQDIRFGPCIKEGKTCNIYSCIWETNRKFVAAKLFKSDMQPDDINRELGHMKQLTDSNVVKCFGFTLKDGRKAMILELIEGGSLHTLLNDYGNFNQTLIRKYVRQVLDALSVLKTKQIIHGRIRCQNLLSDLNGNIKLTQPRLKHLGDTDLEEYKYWTSPEVLAGGKATDKSDIWSLGCTIIEMATGRNPWPESTITQLKKKLQAGKTPEIPLSLSPDCKSFVGECLKINGSQRTSVQELKKHKFLSRA